jgi:hypothetical protein
MRGGDERSGSLFSYVDRPLLPRRAPAPISIRDSIPGWMNAGGHSTTRKESADEVLRATSGLRFRPELQSEWRPKAQEPAESFSRF